MKVAVVGVTGLVGNVMCRVLEESKFPVSTFIPVASGRSVGKLITLNGKQTPVISMEDAVSVAPDIALFSAGGGVSKDWAPKFAAKGTTVIDNSSAWRMDPDIHLVVPEINADALSKQDKIIANPNCSTIQMVLAIAPLHRAFGIKRMVVSTYQSITGTGQKAVDQFDAERNNEAVEDPAYPYRIFENCLPHCDVFLDNDYTKEEMKLVNETRKILNEPDLAITATAVRVPVKGGHSEAVNIEFEQPFTIEKIRTLLRETPGVIVQDDVRNNIYPMPLTAHNRNEVFVGRIRRDDSVKNGLNLWIVSDNLRKGAATNAVQIAAYLAQNELV
jgi:aspartate-semialdehyde dehydrogenase